MPLDFFIGAAQIIVGYDDEEGNESKCCQPHGSIKSVDGG